MVEELKFVSAGKLLHVAFTSLNLQIPCDSFSN